MESNGDLARLIAKRNFNRNRTNSFKNTRKRQRKYSKKSFTSKTGKSGSLNTYFPETGMFGTETTFVSSPEDLIEITNAENLFSIDYYEGTDRVSAALATKTRGTVYNHTKTICDRLNESQLLDVRMVTLQGHELVYSQLQRANGAVEYAITFSVKDEGNVQRLYSLWNLDAYPTGDYRNFQVWGSSMGQVTSIVNHVLKTLDAEKNLVPHKAKDVLPTVFIKNGYYRQGKLHLNIVNKVGATWMTVDGNYKSTELATEQNMHQTLTLTGAWEEEVILDSGYLFDIGISVLAENSYQYDTMYLADGPWGADYNAAADSLAEFDIMENGNNVDMDGYQIERNVSVKGEVKETINIFRNLLAGDLRMDISDYNFLQFDIVNDRPIEISLVTDATELWEERLRITLEPNPEKTQKSIAFLDFRNHLGEAVDFTEIKSIVCSVQGDYENYGAFVLGLDNLALTENAASAEDDVIEDKEPKMDSTSKEIADGPENVELVNYPNPFTDYTLIRLPKRTSEVRVTLTNLQGQQVYHEQRYTENGDLVRVEAADLLDGLYLYSVSDLENNLTYQGKLIKS